MNSFATLFEVKFENLRKAQVRVFVNCCNSYRNWKSSTPFYRLNHPPPPPPPLQAERYFREIRPSQRIPVFPNTTLHSKSTWRRALQNRPQIRKCSVAQLINIYISITNLCTRQLKTRDQDSEKSGCFNRRQTVQHASSIKRLNWRRRPTRVEEKPASSIPNS